jgi:hypothetical protein
LSEQLVGGAGFEISGGGAHRDLRGHQHPAGRAVGVTRLLDHAEEFDRPRFAPTETSRNPHAEKAVVAKRGEGRFGQHPPGLTARRLAGNKRMQLLGFLDQ